MNIHPKKQFKFSRTKVTKKTEQILNQRNPEIDSKIFCLEASYFHEPDYCICDVCEFLVNNPSSRFPQNQERKQYNGVLMEDIRMQQKSFRDVSVVMDNILNLFGNRVQDKGQTKYRNILKITAVGVTTCIFMWAFRDIFLKNLNIECFVLKKSRPRLLFEQPTNYKGFGMMDDVKLFRNKESLERHGYKSIVEDDIAFLDGEKKLGFYL
jgi:hypothetical protein